jgi:hypothetical protein
VLGVPTLEYAPWALFNYLNPFVALGYALTGFHVERIPPEDVRPADAVTAVPAATPPSDQPPAA